MLTNRDQFDNDASLRAAYAALPLDKFLTSHGTGPKSPGESWKAFECPFCHKKKKAGIFKADGVDLLKCLRDTCDGNKAMDAVGFLKLHAGLNGKDAFVAYLKEAGVFVEPEKKSIPVTPPAENPPKFAVDDGDVQPSKPKKAKPVPEPPPPTPPDEEEVKGREVLEYFFSRLQPTCQQIVPVEKLPDPLPSAVARMVTYKNVSFFKKRGLTTTTCTALGYAANPESNMAILIELEGKFSMDALLASGLWQPKKGQSPRRPNKQFAGLGQLGRKPEGERRGRDDKWVWASCQPTLIPYVDELGKIIKLRPHKGGASEGTLCGAPRIYVPRDFRVCADRAESYRIVIICEGEYKAAAIWQVLGSGSTYLPAVGVCAIPGITFGKHFELRLELEAWLEQVGCNRVIVAFDDQDNTSKPMRDRHAANIWARVLSHDLSRQLHIVGLTSILPRDWRDDKGKADFDGALAQFRQQTQTKK